MRPPQDEIDDCLEEYGTAAWFTDTGEFFDPNDGPCPINDNRPVELVKLTCTRELFAQLRRLRSTSPGGATRSDLPQSQEKG